MTTDKRCKYCKRKPTRYYNQKRLCLLHYVLENPDRNKNFVDWDKINRLKTFKSGEKEKLNEIKKSMEKEDC